MYRAEIINSRTAIIYWFFTVSYMGIIFYLSSLEKIELPPLPENSDKLLHICAYLFLALLTSFSLYKSGIKKYVLMLAFLIATLYGISDEIHQAFVPGRDAGIDDVIADSIGASLGSILAGRVRVKK